MRRIWCLNSVCIAISHFLFAYSLSPSSNSYLLLFLKNRSMQRVGPLTNNVKDTESYLLRDCYPIVNPIHLLGNCPSFFLLSPSPLRDNLPMFFFGSSLSLGRGTRKIWSLYSVNHSYSLFIFICSTFSFIRVQMRKIWPLALFGYSLLPSSFCSYSYLLRPS